MTTNSSEGAAFAVFIIVLSVLPLLLPLILLPVVALKVAVDKKESDGIRYRGKLIFIGFPFFIFILGYVIVLISNGPTYQTNYPTKIENIHVRPSIPPKYFDTTGYLSVERDLSMRIHSFATEAGGSVKIIVDVILDGDVDKDIDLSNITMNFTAHDGKSVLNIPISSATKFHMHPPQKLTMELQYSGVGKGPAYTFNYSYSSETISLGTFR